MHQVLIALTVFLQFGKTDLNFRDGSVVHGSGGLCGLQCGPDYGSAGQCVFQCGFGFHYAYLIFAVVQYKECIAFMYLLMFGKINLLDVA